MTKELQDRIRTAVEEGRKARHAYYTAIDLPDEQELGPPATEAELTALETWLKKRLPPSYRTFLQLYNGWRMANGAVDLLSVSEMLEGPRADLIREWQQEAAAAGPSVAANSLVIGFGEISPLRFLLNPKHLDDAGEWEFVGYDNDEQWTKPSFLVWLEDSLRDFQELVQEETEGENEEIL